MSGHRLAQLKNARWMKLQRFLAFGNTYLTTEEKEEKMRIVRRRVNMEKDINRLLQLFSDCGGDLDTLAAEGLLKGVTGKYRFNKQEADFSQVCPISYVHPVHVALTMYVLPSQHK
jgi:hypothetical protein